ncbi:MAG: glycosyltransferase family 2 protein [Candidatus Entotheonellia bacterium]
MRSRPLVSVVIPFWNAAKFLREAIDSVIAQSYRYWELLLVDDGSTDGSPAIACEYAEQWPKKVRYLHHSGHQNRGGSVSRNLGFRYAKGEYVAMLDADDIWLPYKLEQQVQILRAHPETSVLYGNTLYWYSWTGCPEDSQKDFMPELAVEPNTVVLAPTLLILSYPLGLETAPSASNLIFQRDVVERTGGFEESLRWPYDDQGFLVKVYLKEAVYVAGDCWDWYRQRAETSTAITERSTEYDAVRWAFLNWLADYLSRQRVRDAVVWEALRRALRPYVNAGTSVDPVQIIDVSMAQAQAAELFGCNVEGPQRGNVIEGYTFHLIGWVLGRSAPAAAVEVVCDGTVIQHIPIAVRRPDVAAAYPQVPCAAQCGFQAKVAVPGRDEFELLVRVILDDQSRVPIGVIRAQRHCTTRT